MRSMMEKKYRTLLFDLDNTLIDFQKSEEKALHNILLNTGCHDYQMVLDLYIQINQFMWKQLENDILSMKYVQEKRFEILYSFFGKKVDGEELDAQFKRGLIENIYLIDDALKVCNELFEKYSIYIVTNGSQETQVSRVKGSGLNDFIKKIYTSEYIGYNKPSYKFFDFVINDLDSRKEDILMIGDSLSTDIKGGIDYGIDTCWYNIHKSEDIALIRPTYTIKKLSDILQIL